MVISTHNSISQNILFSERGCEESRGWGLQFTLLPQPRHPTI